MSGVGDFSGTIAAGRYRLVRPLVPGGRVHEARHERMPGRFALKVLGAVDARAFRRGAHLAAALHHDAIVKVVDHGSTAEGAFVVMEWVAGSSLRELLARRGSLSPAEVAGVVDGVALALEVAQRQGLAHGHISPERVLVVDPRDLVGATGGYAGGSSHLGTKLLGFGLDPTELGASSLSAARDTPYTAPERHANGASARADQFSLGALAYELLTGAPPDADLPTRRPPRSVREFDPTIGVQIDEVIQRALYFDPRARWDDVHTFAQRLREATDAERSPFENEERTRLAPLPLTVSRPPQVQPSPLTRTPTPIHLPPVVASVDVDLRTPAPMRLSAFPQGGLVMNAPPNAPNARPPAPPPHRAPAAPLPLIHPTPTFSFADEPAPSPLDEPRRGNTGRLLLALLVLGAGGAGYLAVEGRSLHELDPYVKRAGELARSLRTLAPGASPDPVPVGAVAPVPAPAAPPPSLHPEVVPIPPSTPPGPRGTTAAAKSASKSWAQPSPRSSAKATASSEDHRPRAPRPHRVARGGGPAPSSTALSDEAATEEALLAGPSGGR
ncbi:MAG TPA: serine/threonine-protein kinase [Polyangia bacterium]|nr:serine/threonine-protein kinase [Polyangia bacterium]